MSRPLVGPLDAIMLSKYREPKWKIEIFDIRSAVSDTIGSVVRELALETITGPREFTSDTAEFSYNEIASDFSTTGVSVPSLTLKIIEPGASFFDPVRNPTGLGRYLRRGNTVQLRQGDARVPEADWPITFTGNFVGQAGLIRRRTDDMPSMIGIKALGREADAINVPLTSDDYGIGQSLNAIARDIAQADMGLDSSEINWSNWGSQLNGHLSLQFVELPPIVAIANLMMIDGLMPRFEGDGRLGETLGLITQSPDRIYTSRRLFTGIDRPPSEIDPFNSILVKGLDADQSKITQPLQPLIEDLHITTGYFSSDEEFDVPWTKDERQLATGIQFTIIKSANGGISFLGGGETFATIPAPIGTGTIGATITISTGFAPYVLIFFGLVYVTLAAIPDAVLAFGGGVTVSVGRIIQALALAVVLTLMTKIGKGQYSFLGEPFEYVYAELSGKAELPDLTTQTRKLLTIQNQVLQTQSDVNTVARVTLDRQTVLGLPRVANMIPDLKLTADDVFQIPAEAPDTNPELYQVQGISYVGRRTADGGFTETAKLNVSEISAIGKG